MGVWGAGMINRKSARLPKWYGPSPDLPARSLGSASAKAGGFGPQGRGRRTGGYDYEQTFIGSVNGIRFTPESRHNQRLRSMSAYDPKRTFFGLCN